METVGRFELIDECVSHVPMSFVITITRYQMISIMMLPLPNGVVASMRQTFMRQTLFVRGGDARCTRCAHINHKMERDNRFCTGIDERKPRCVCYTFRMKLYCCLINLVFCIFYTFSIPLGTGAVRTAI